jgi:hypothetical protein
MILTENTGGLNYPVTGNQKCDGIFPMAAPTALDAAAAVSGLQFVHKWPTAHWNFQQGFPYF